MKKPLLIGLGLLFSATVVNAQQRYLEEIFTDSEITVMKNVEYGINVNPLFNTSLLDPTYVGSKATQIGTENAVLKGRIAAGGWDSIPTTYKLPYAIDGSTELKVQRMLMDVYMPSSTADTETNRPVMVYIHTGNFLPPIINGGVGGSKEDSAAVEICKQWAKRGFVAVAVNYRHGWNPTALGAAGLVARRATLLNAVYRAIHDVKHAVKYVRANDATYGIDPTRIGIYGQGSGGYVALAYATLDKPSEYELPKFVFGGNSVIQPAVVGDIEGNGGLINLYTDNGESSEISVCVNAGGAIGDIRWLEAGDAPMVTFHSPYDEFAPYDTGTVIVPTTGDEVVDVNGPNMFIKKANDLGNNDVFKDFLADNYTTRARSFFGTTFENSGTVNINADIVAADAEGLFPFVVTDDNTGDIEYNGSPWEWWTEADVVALAAATSAATGSNYDGALIHQNGLISNPNMSKTQALAYIDTIQGYAVPRIVKAMAIPGYESVNVNELYLSKLDVTVFPNPANGVVNFKTSNPNYLSATLQIFDLSGRNVMAASNVNSNIATLDLSDLSEGLYVAEVRTTEGKTVTTKFMVK